MRIYDSSTELSSLLMVDCFANNRSLNYSLPFCLYSDFTLWYLLMYSQLLELNLIESLQAWEAHNPSICPLAASFFLCMYKTFVNCPWSLHFPAQRCISIFTQEKKKSEVCSNLEAKWTSCVIYMRFSLHPMLFLMYMLFFVCMTCI